MTGRLTENKTVCGVGFIPEMEAVFLGSLVDSEHRRLSLGKEIETAVGEATFQVRFNERYEIREGRIFDKRSGLYLVGVTEKSGREKEVLAMRRIETELDKGVDLVVHFSPKNEEYDYPDDVIDFWRIEKGEVIWQRVVVEENGESMLELYKVMGGTEAEDSKDLLANPIGTDNYTVGGVLALIEINKRNRGFAGYREVSDEMVSRFYEEYGDGLFTDSKLIFRLFSVVMAEVKLMSGSRIDGGVWKVVDNKMRFYFEASMMNKVIKAAGCGRVNVVGEFGAGRGMVVSVKDGKVTVVEGETSGLNFCEQCGCYYSGSRCRLCS